MTRITIAAAVCICITAIPLHADTFTLTSPNGGEVWEAGTTQTVTWQLNGATYSADVYRYKGDALIEQLNTAPYTSSPFAWTICQDYEPGDDYSIKVVTVGLYIPQEDFSDAPFEITNNAFPTLDLTSPNGAELWWAGEPQTITWNSSNARGFVDIELYDNGQFQRRIGRVPMADGQFTWDVCHWLTNSSDYTIRIRWDAACGPVVVEDESIWPFAILNATPLPKLILTHPSGGETFDTDSIQTITWESIDTLGNVELWLTDSMATTNGHYFEYIGSAPMKEGRFDWAIPPCLPNGADYSVLLHWEDCGAIVEEANTVGFALAGSYLPTLELTSPIYNDIWNAGSSVQTTWTAITSNGIITNNGEVEVQLLDYDTGALVTVLGKAPVAAGSFSTTLCPGIPDGNYQVRLAMLDCAARAESSRFSTDGSTTPTLELTSPIGGESWEAGTTQNITWTSTNLIGYVDLYLPCESPTCSSKVTVPVSDQSYAWRIPPTLAAATNYKVIIRSSDCGTFVTDQSTTFAVTPPTAAAGDFDDDGDVDLQDLAIFQTCHTGRGPTLLAIPCDSFDLEPDADVDADDLQIMLNEMTGPATQED